MTSPVLTSDDLIGVINSFKDENPANIYRIERIKMLKEAVESKDRSKWYPLIQEFEKIKEVKEWVISGLCQLDQSLIFVDTELSPEEEEDDFKLDRERDMRVVRNFLKELKLDRFNSKQMSNDAYTSLMCNVFPFFGVCSTNRYIIWHYLASIGVLNEDNMYKCMDNREYEINSFIRLYLNDGKEKLPEFIVDFDEFVHEDDKKIIPISSYKLTKLTKDLLSTMM